MRPTTTSFGRFHLLAAMIIACLSLTFVLIQYDRFRQTEPNLELWYQVKLAGTLSNGDQYRIGMPFLAHFLEVHTSLEMRQSIPLLEGLSYSGGLICLYLLLIQSRTFRNGHSFQRLALCGFFFAAVQLPVLWIFPWERPETLPTMFFLSAATLVILQQRIPLALACALTFLLSFGQSLVRTDAPIFLGAATLIGGMFVPFSRSRRAVMLLGSICVATGVIVHLYLLHRFPNAHPEQREATIRLSENFNPLNPFMRSVHVIEFLSALLPLFFVLFLIHRHRGSIDPADWLIILIALLYLPVYILLGIIAEVRIYVPYLFVLSPVFAKLWVRFAVPTTEPQA